MARRPGSSERVLTAGAIKFDTNELKWVEQEFEYLFRIDAPNDSSGRDSSSFIFNSLEAGLYGLLYGSSRAMNQNGRALIKVAKLKREDHGSIFPWLPWPDRSITFRSSSNFRKVRERFDLNKPLVGQSVNDIGLALGSTVVTAGRFQILRLFLEGTKFRQEPLNYPLSGVPIVTYELISLSFEAGSFWSEATIRQKFLAGVMGVLGLGFVGTEIAAGIDRVQREQAFEQQFKVASKGPAAELCGQRCSLDKLRDNTESAFDYNEKGISAEEKKTRIGKEQIAINMGLGMDLNVDGKLGPKTLQAERDFGMEFKTPGTNSSAYFRTKLAKQFILPPPTK